MDKGTALVTGGGRGIGRSVCKALAQVGFDVAIVSMESPAEAAPVVADVEAFGRAAMYVQQDIADIAAHAPLVERICAGLGPLACLVNNAGVTSLRRGDMLELTADSFDRSVQINLRGTFFLAQAVARHMLTAKPPNARSRYRSIVTITSANADILGLDRADYCITKAGLSMMSKLFAARLAPEDIYVFEIRPGIIRTDMTQPAAERYDRFIENDGVPLQRWGAPDEVGATVATIAEGRLPFATGEVLNVGGGLHLYRV